MTAEIIQFGGGTPQPQANPAPVDAAYLKDVAAAYRSRDHIREDMDKHIAARDAYGKAVAWEAAAESQNLPPSQIEAARQRTAAAYAELQDCGRRLVVCMPHDLRGLVDLLLYLEQNWTALPEVIRTHHNANGQSIAFSLLRTMRLSLRAVGKIGKYEGSRDDK
jgi:hypothetical protein